MIRPLSCTEMDALLPEWAEGGLQAEARVRVNSHVQTCARCAAEAAAWRRLSTTLTTHFATRRPPVPEGLASQIQRVVRLDMDRRSIRRRQRARIAALLTLTATAIAMFALWQVPSHLSPPRPLAPASPDAAMAWGSITVWALLGLAVSYILLGADLGGVRQLFSHRRCRS